jgi:hypothetical protein
MTDRRTVPEVPHPPRPRISAATRLEPTADDDGPSPPVRRNTQVRAVPLRPRSELRCWECYGLPNDVTGTRCTRCSDGPIRSLRCVAMADCPQCSEYGRDVCCATCDGTYYVRSQ